MSVSTKPGQTQFTRTPSLAWASARLLVMLITAALLALYGRLLRLPILPAIDATLTILPRFCAIIRDRKSTRLNSSHEWISYAVFCLKKKHNDAGNVFDGAKSLTAATGAPDPRARLSPRRCIRRQPAPSLRQRYASYGLQHAEGCRRV